MVGSGNGILVSTNGIHWEEHENAFGLMRVHFDGSRFIGVGPRVAASADGVNWTNVSDRYLNLRDIRWANGRYVGCNAPIYYDDDDDDLWYGEMYAMFWPNSLGGGSEERRLVRTPFDSSQPAIAYGGGRFAIVAGSGDGRGAIFSSPDGSAWANHSAAANDALFGVEFAGGQFVAVGNHGVIVTSPDAQDWTPRTQTSPRNFRGLVRGGGRYVASGNEGLLMTSWDGRNWEYQTLPVTNNLRGVAFKDGLYVGVGAKDASGATILLSSNASSWTRSGGITPNGLYDIAVFNDLFIAVGEEGEILVSGDGRTWSSYAASSRVRFNSVADCGELVIAVGRDGTVVTSPDGRTGTHRHRLQGASLQGIAAGNGVFVAIGQGGFTLVFHNALVWTQYAAPFRNDIEDLSFADGLFVGVGEDGMVATSPDGILWAPQLSRNQNTLRGVIYEEGRLLAVGNNEQFCSRPFLGRHDCAFAEGWLRVDSNSRSKASKGRNYWLQASDDLTSWENVMFFNNRRDTTLFLDPSVDGTPRRFYRVLAE